LAAGEAEMAAPMLLSSEDVLRVNGSRRFAAAMAAASPFASLADALLAARRIWLNEVCHILAVASSTSLLYPYLNFCPPADLRFLLY